MPAENQNASVHRGESKTLYFPVYDRQGALVDLTGKDVYYALATKERGPRLLLLSLSAGDLHLASGVEDVPDGSVGVPLTRERTLALKATDYYHEVYSTENGGHLFSKGTLTILPALIAQHEAA